MEKSVYLQENKAYKGKEFLVQDKFSKNQLEVKQRWTENMWYDILNKPKQGTYFKVFHGELMNVPENYYDGDENNNTHPKLFPQEKRGTMRSML